MVGKGESGEAKPVKVNRSSMLPVDLVERARNAVFWCRMVEGEPASYAELTERGVRREVERLEAAYNEGRPFTHGDLRPGPAAGVMQRVARMRAQAAEEGDDERAE